MKRILPSLAIVSILLCSCVDKPEADFTWSPTHPQVGESVHFTNLSMNANSYDWNFGDMSIGREENPIHTYTFAGDFIIDLVAHNGLRSDIKTVTITISD